MDLPDTRDCPLEINQLEAALSQSRAHGSFGLTARGKPDMTLSVDVNGQTEWIAVHSPRCELELV